MKTKILFFIFDLGGGGAEKVLVNLVNNLSPEKYDITIRTIFDKGINVKNLKPNIKYFPFFKRKPFRGFGLIQKFFSPKFLHKIFIKGEYDIEIAYLQHTPTRIIAGAKKGVKKFAWVHTNFVSSKAYRNIAEFKKIYNSFDGTAFVSKEGLQSFIRDYSFNPKGKIVHNVNETEKIKKLSEEPIPPLSHSITKLCSMGRFAPEKGFERLIKDLGFLYKEGLKDWHFYLLGQGDLRPKYEELLQEHNIRDKFTFLGYQDNPYKYLSKMDLFVCSSYEEGYSTAVTESIVVGTPILTTDCSGMEEILEGSGAGIIVPNNDESLYLGLKEILLKLERLDEMKQAAKERSKIFSTETAIKEFEDFISR